MREQYLGDVLLKLPFNEIVFIYTDDYDSNISINEQSYCCKLISPADAFAKWNVDEFFVKVLEERYEYGVVTEIKVESFVNVSYDDMMKITDEWLKMYPDKLDVNILNLPKPNPVIEVRSKKVSFCKMLRDIRLIHGFSYREMGDRLGIPYSTYYRYENGKVSPTIETLVDIFDKLDYDLKVTIKAREEF